MYYLSIRKLSYTPPHGVPADALRLYESRERAAHFGEVVAEFSDYTEAVRAYVGEVYAANPRVHGTGIAVANHDFPCTEIAIVESVGVWKYRRKAVGSIHAAVVRASLGDYDYVWDCGNGSIAMEYCRDVPFVILTNADPANRHMFTIMLREEFMGV